MKMTKIKFDNKLKKIQEHNEQIEMRIKLRKEKKKVRGTSFCRKIKTSNIALFATITAIILYTIACFFIQYTSGMEVSATLIQLWFAFWTVEIAALTGIKVTKVIRKNNVITDETKREDNEFDDVKG